MVVLHSAPPLTKQRDDSHHFCEIFAWQLPHEMYELKVAKALLGTCTEYIIPPIIYDFAGVGRCLVIDWGRRLRPG